MTQKVEKKINPGRKPQIRKDSFQLLLGNFLGQFENGTSFRHREYVKKSPVLKRDPRYSNEITLSGDTFQIISTSFRVESDF